jgi:hypothetical protein
LALRGALDGKGKIGICPEIGAKKSISVQDRKSVSIPLHVI